MTTKKERAEALARMTKAELIKTVKTLDARQVKLLNRIAALESKYDPVELQTGVVASGGQGQRFPWETAATLPNPFGDK